MEVDGALCDAEVKALGRGIDKADIGVRPDADKGLAYLNLCLAIVVGDNAVAGAERKVGKGLAKVVRAYGLEGDVAGDVREPSSLGGRVGLCASGQSGQRQQCCCA